MARCPVLWLAGVACICVVAVIWTLATVLKQVVFSDLRYNEPLVLTYVCNGCYVLQLPLFCASQAFGLSKAVPWQRQQSSGAPEDGLYASAPASPSEGARAREPGQGGSVVEAIRAGLIIAPIWFASQWTYTDGVARTSVTSSTVISTTSVVWTLLASWLFLGERLTALKLLGVAVCMAGNVATLWGNDMEAGQTQHFSGDILCLIAAMLYATYTTLLMVLTGPDTPLSVVFGTVGVAILAVGAPLVFTLRWDALRSMSAKIFMLLIFNGVFDNVLSQYVWAKGVQWTSPTTATVGLSLTIPLSIVADVVRRKTLTAWSFVAAALVVLGFLLVTLASSPDAAESAKRGHAEGAAARGEGSSSLSLPLSPSGAAMASDGGLEVHNRVAPAASSGARTSSL